MKQFIALITLCVLTLSLSAQRKFLFGSMVGFNSCEFVGSDATETEAKPGIHLGTIAQYLISDHFNLHSEAMLNFAGSGYESSGDINLFYVQLPVLAQAVFGAEDVRPFLSAGPYLGLLLGKEVEETPLTQRFKTLDFGGMVGAGLIFRAEKFNVYTDLRAMRSITPIAWNITGFSQESLTLKNFMIGLSLGVF